MDGTFNQIAIENREYSNLIERYLSEKYKETFVVESIGGRYGIADNNSVYAWCFNTNTPELKFMSSITKDHQKMSDTYINILVAEKYSREYTSKIGEYFGDVFIIAYFETPNHFSDESADDLSISKFVASKMDLYVTTYIVVPDSDFDNNERARFTLEFGRLSASFNIPDNRILVFFVKEFSRTTYQNLCYKNYMNLYNFLDTYVMKVASTCCSVVGGELVSSLDDVLNELGG